MKVAVDGGVPSTLCDVPLDFDSSSGSDNRIVFAPGSDTGLSSVSAVGGKAEKLTVAGKPRLLFEQPGLGSGAPIRGWDISRDGRRFLMVRFEERKPQPVTEMILVQNWFEELKRLCPTGKN